MTFVVESGLMRRALESVSASAAARQAVRDWDQSSGGGAALGLLIRVHRTVDEEGDDTIFHTGAMRREIRTGVSIAGPASRAM